MLHLFIPLIIFSFLSLYPNSAKAEESLFHLTRNSVTLQNSEGEDFFLGSRSFLRQVNSKNNLDKWYSEVRLVDDYNMPISNETFRLASRYLNRSISMQFKDSLEVLDPSTGQTLMMPENSRFVQLDRVQTGWNYYEIIRVNDDGLPLDNDGNPVNPPATPPVYRVSISSFEDHMMRNEMEYFFFLIEGMDSNTVAIYDACPITEIRPPEDKSPTPPAKPIILTQGSTPKIPLHTSYDLPKVTPYSQLMAERNSLRGRNDCESRRRAIEAEMMAETPWAGLDIYQRADKIHQLAQIVESEIKDVASKSGRSGQSQSRFRDSVNPHYIAPGVDPSLATCIVFQETRGLLNYISHNYTYCQNTQNPASTAHGLGQITRRTFRLMKNLGDGDQFPYETPTAQKYRGKSVVEAHQAISSDPMMQMELVLRQLNYEYKFSRWRNGNMTHEQLIRNAVARYDRDNQSAYLQNVVDRCLPCMQSGKSASVCYKEIFE